MRKGLGAIFLVLMLGLIGFGIYYLSTHKIDLPEIKFARALSEEINVDNYTNALDDLQKDENFNADNFLAIEDNYSIQVVQIAESKDSELFIYTYEPSEQTQASTINISTAINESLSYKNYKLTFLNKSGTLAKYLVNDLEVKKDALRYYDISSIFRPFNEKIDGEQNKDNEVTEVSFAVGQLWTAVTVDGQKSYSYTTTETITITDKYVSYIRYSNGFKFFDSSCDGHFVAFSTDKQIDKLMEADIYFISREFTTTKSLLLGERTSYGDPKEEYKKLTYTDVASNSANGIGGKKYTWNRIENINDFIANEELTDATKEKLQNKQWVLRFLETGYSFNITGQGNSFSNGTEVNEVTILRLKFETDGVVYNLGTVDNKQNSSDYPANIEIKGLSELLQLIIKLVPIVIIGMLLIACFPTILNYVFIAIGWVFQGIWFILTLPFQILKTKTKGENKWN